MPSGARACGGTCCCRGSACSRSKRSSRIVCRGKRSSCNLFAVNKEGGLDPRERLIDVIRSVRNRWRLRLALRGTLVVVAGTILALFLSASGLESFRFSTTAIIAFRIISVAVFVALLAYGLVWPLRRRVTDA